MGGNKNQKSNDRYVVPAVDQAARILFCLADAETSHLSLTEICAKTDIYKSQAFSILHTLQTFSLAQRNLKGKGYSLGPGLITLSRKVLDNFNAPRLAEPFLEELAKKSGSTATLGLIVDNQIVVVAKYESGHDVGITVRIGRRFPLTHGAEGKAIAAFLPKQELDKLYQNPDLNFYGKQEKLNRTRLHKELKDCRRLGYALDLGELRQGFHAVAAPVLGPSGAPIGHISIIGLLSAESARQLGPLVAEVGKTLSRQLGARVD